MIKRTLKTHKCITADKYMGAPLVLSRKPTNGFGDITSKVLLLIKGWRTKHLSQAGKLALINSVTSAIPTHVISVFSLPDETCNKLDSMNNNFFWGKNENNNNKIHFIGWRKITNSNPKGA